ncbi:hypothetical protein ACI3L1_17590 [Deinococcus sp. SM5_A1]|uniref:hypothetical protein n=1 Tax=Deinococcus sp. SM5_A1 TaxID=3379094 RepID=UPI00385C25E1
MLNAEKLIEQADQILDGGGRPDQDWQDALRLYQTAGKMGSGTAYQKIGDLYANGRHTEIDLQKSILNYRKSVKQGHMPALSSIAVIYTLIGDYNNTIYHWERYFKYLDKEKIVDTSIAAKAIFYLLLKVGNKGRFNVYDCFSTGLDAIFIQIDEDIEKIIKLINQKIRSLKDLQEYEEMKTIQRQIVEEINDLDDLKKCRIIFLNVLARDQ